MVSEREHEPSVEDVDVRSPGSGANERDPQGQIQSAEWTTSTYRSSRRFRDVPGKASKPVRRKAPRPEGDT